MTQIILDLQEVVKDYDKKRAVDKVSFQLPKGAIFGLLAAFGTLFPNTQLMLLFPPIPIKAKYLVIGLMVISVYLGLNQFEGDNIAHFAHVGGGLVGFIMVKIWQRNRTTFY